MPAPTSAWPHGRCTPLLSPTFPPVGMVRSWRSWIGETLMLADADRSAQIHLVRILAMTGLADPA